MMGMERFRELVEAYGAEPGRWPANERGAAEALLAGNAEAARLRKQAATLDAMLDKASLPEAAFDAETLIAAVTGEPQRTAEIVTLRPVRRQSGSSFWLKVASLAAAAAIGFLVGVTQLGGLGGDPSTPTNGLELADVSPW